MKDLNTLTIIGRLTRDAECRYTSSGMAIVSFSIANNRPKKDGDRWVDEANYFDVDYFGKSAEGLKQYLTKGKQVAICGSLKQSRWEKDGQTHSKVTINADDVQLVGGQSQQNQNQTQGGYQNQPQVGYQQSQQRNYGNMTPPQVQNIQQTFSGFVEDVPF